MKPINVNLKNAYMPSLLPTYVEILAHAHPSYGTNCQSRGEAGNASESGVVLKEEKHEEK